MMPSRIQLKRTRGWRLRDESTQAVICDRRSAWGNAWIVAKTHGTHLGQKPWSVKHHQEPTAYFDTKLQAATYAVQRHGRFYDENPDAAENVREHLVGADLCCWCGLLDPCHVDNLLRIANHTTATTCEKGP